MSQKIETNSRLNANMASNSSQSKSVTFDLDNMNSSGYNEASQNQITNSMTNSLYGENTSSQFSSGSQGLTPECIRVVSEAISGPILQEEAAKEQEVTQKGTSHYQLPSQLQALRSSSELQPFPTLLLHSSSEL